MRVKFIGLVRDAFGTPETQVEARGVEEALRLLDARHPGKILEDERLRSAVLVLVNGHSITSLQGLGTELKPGDELTILTLTAGG
ncbi:MAG: MoaD/ThiS family protein [Deltaproteobacteria bacterium]|nr:MoaD/ThiS family protein [Deltaproteobacteria bacterium]